MMITLHLTDAVSWCCTGCWLTVMVYLNKTQSWGHSLKVMSIFRKDASDSLSSSEAGPVDPRCNLRLDLGTCRNYSIHWYYDKQSNSCAQFWYGGCGGNDNRYKTEDECKKTCVVRKTGKFSKFTTSNMYIIYIFFWSYIVSPHNRLKGEESIAKGNVLTLQSADSSLWCDASRQLCSDHFMLLS